MNVSKKTAAGTWMLPKGRMSYPFLLTPSENKTAKGKAKYSLTLVMPKDSDLAALKKEMYNIAFAERTKMHPASAKDKAAQDVKDRFLDPTTTGNNPFGDEFEGWTMLRMATVNRPSVINAQGNRVEDDQDIYPGRWARATCRPYWFVTKDKTNRGVTCDLINVQILEDDEPFAGSARVSPEDEFEPVTGRGG